MYLSSAFRLKTSINSVSALLLLKCCCSFFHCFRCP